MTASAPASADATRGFAALGSRRAADERRMAMSAAAYAREHDLDLFVVEALKHVARCSAAANDAGALKPRSSSASIHDEPSPGAHIELAAEYFHAVAVGRHVHGREWDFVEASARNKCAFVNAFKRVASGAARLGTRMKREDWHAMATLTCADVPPEVTRAVFETAAMFDEDGDDDRGDRGDRDGDGDRGGGGGGAVELAFEPVFAALKAYMLGAHGDAEEIMRAHDERVRKAAAAAEAAARERERALGDGDDDDDDDDGRAAANRERRTPRGRGSRAKAHSRGGSRRAGGARGDDR